MKKLLLAGCGAFLALAIVACKIGTSSTPRGDSNDYYSELESTFDNVGARVLNVSPPNIGPGASFEDVRTEVSRYFAEFAANVDAEIAKIEVLVPPAEAQVQHNSFVAALNTVSLVFDDAASRAANARSIDEGRTALDSATVDAAFERLVSACFDLQSLANENGSDVDLGCDS